MIRHTLAANIKRLRLGADLTQAQLAERADIGLATLQRIERAEGSASIDKLEALANALATTPSALLETTTMQELIIAIKTASDLDALTNAINALADWADDQGPQEDEYGHMHKLNHLALAESEGVDWPGLPRWGEEPVNAYGSYSWDATRIMWLRDGRAILVEREDV